MTPRARHNSEPTVLPTGRVNQDRESRQNSLEPHSGPLGQTTGHAVWEMSAQISRELQPNLCLNFTVRCAWP